MAKNKKPSKAYRPKRNLVNPLGWVLEGTHKLTRKQITDTLIRVYAAFDEIVHGRGNVELWRTVTGALNMAIVLDEQVCGGVRSEVLKAALKAHARCGARGEKGVSLGYSGPDLGLLREALEIHSMQIKLITISEVESALDECERRARTPGEHFTLAEMAKGATHG